MQHKWAWEQQHLPCQTAGMLQEPGQTAGALCQPMLLVGGMAGCPQERG